MAARKNSDDNKTEENKTPQKPQRQSWETDDSSNETLEGGNSEDSVQGGASPQDGHSEYPTLTVKNEDGEDETVALARDPENDALLEVEDNPDLVVMINGYGKTANVNRKEIGSFQRAGYRLVADPDAK